MRIRDKARSRRRPPLVVAAMLCAMVLVPAVARPAEGRPAESTQAVFSRLAEAWRTADAQALSDLVHPDGLHVTGGAGARGGRYSPSQAFYFFKNLFRAQRTLDFEFRMMQDGAGADSARGVARWQKRPAYVSAIGNHMPGSMELPY